jgi:ATP-dependent phosphofructokinase / diphosphate-dependent phosphofructokinase
VPATFADLRNVVLDPLRLDAAMMRLGGTILGTTSKGDPFAFPMPDGSLSDRSREVIDAYHALRLDALIGIGGDGSFAILRRLAQQGGLPLVAMPKTIDNDSATPRLRSAMIRR